MPVKYKIGILLVLFCLSTFAQNPLQFRFTESSMEPTYQTNQLVDLYSGVKFADAGDVALIKSPIGLYLSRVLAVAGDEIKFISSTGLFYRNGKTMPMIKTGEVSPDGKYKKIQTSTGKRSHFVYEGEMWDQTVLAYLKIKMFEEKEDTSEPYMSKKDCRVEPGEFVCKVPRAHVFIKGDHRDISQMGFVANTNLVGFVR